jgi:hypothetical protein
VVPRSFPETETIGIAEHIVIERVPQALIFEVIRGVDADPLGKDAEKNLSSVKKSGKCIEVKVAEDQQDAACGRLAQLL